MTGYRTIAAMGLALVVALWTSLVGPLPAVDPETVDSVQDVLVSGDDAARGVG